MPLSIKLMTTHTLTFYRPPSGYYSGGVWVSSGSDVEVPDVLGSLQPLSPGKLAKILPEGVETDSAYIFSTKAILQGYSEFSDTLPDYTTIGGRIYEVHEEQPWNSFNLLSDHNRYILVGRVQNVEGGE